MTRPTYAPLRQVLSLLSCAVAALSALLLSACVPGALTAGVAPDASMLGSVTESGIADIGEGMAAGSIFIGDAESPRSIVRWGEMDLSPSGDGQEIRYALRVNAVDRRGLNSERHRGAICYPGKVCRFVTKLAPGSYRISFIKLWAQHLDPNDPGSINKRVDYRFTVGAGEFVYLGRLSMVPPVLSGQTPVMPIEILDRRDDDLAAIGFDDIADEFTLRSEIVQSNLEEPLSYEPPWQWKMVAAPGGFWKPEIVDANSH